MGSLCWPGIICLQLYLAAGKPKNGLSAERESPKTGIKPLGTVGLGWKQKRKFCLFKKWKKPHENKQTKKKIPMINKWTNQPNSTNQKNPGFNPSKLLHAEYAALLHRERIYWEGKLNKTWKLVQQIRYKFWQELSNANAGRWGKRSDPFW